MFIPNYLQRINYASSLKVNKETLSALQEAHLLAVPFENLDITNGRPIQLPPQHLDTKIITQRRGGFCYELNSTFARLLTALGFKVTFLSAQVASSTGEYGPPFDHLVLQVDLEEPWLVDVGFGRNFRQPLRLNAMGQKVELFGTYKLTHPTPQQRILWQKKEGEWHPTQKIDLTPRQLDEFGEMCHYHQTSPKSSFTQKRVCSLALPDGRLTLSNNTLIRTYADGSKEEQEVEETAVVEILSQQFKMGKRE